MTLQSQDYLLAQAITDALAVWFPTNTVELVGDPRAARKDLTALRIRVRPASWSQEAQSRAYDLDTREVHIGIVGACDPNDTEAIDAALWLCDQVRAMWGRNGALRTQPMAGHEPIAALKQSPIFDEKALLEDKLFVGTITVKYATTA
jgi:hypothetical protein